MSPSLLLRRGAVQPVPGESTRERGEDRQVGVERDSIQSANAQG
jgi:hypothetical protein